MKREVNALTDKDFRTRANSLTVLTQVLLETKPALKPCKTHADVVQEVLSELNKPLLRLFSDDREKCRELAVGLYKK